VFDTLYFGSFSKISTVNPENENRSYVYCPGPKSILKLVENQDNIPEITQSVLD
jgi:hypothetical protein